MKISCITKPHPTWQPTKLRNLEHSTQLPVALIGESPFQAAQVLWPSSKATWLFFESSKQHGWSASSRQLNFSVSSKWLVWSESLSVVLPACICLGMGLRASNSAQYQGLPRPSKLYSSCALGASPKDRTIPIPALEHPVVLPPLKIPCFKELSFKLGSLISEELLDNNIQRKWNQYTTKLSALQYLL